MGVVSNKIDITDLQLSGGGGGDPTIPGRVSALETETVQLAEGLALVQTSVSSLDLTVGNENSGLVKETADLSSLLNNAAISYADKSSHYPMQKDFEISNGETVPDFINRAFNEFNSLFSALTTKDRIILNGMSVRFGTNKPPEMGGNSSFSVKNLSYYSAPKNYSPNVRSCMYGVRVQEPTGSVTAPYICELFLGVNRVSGSISELPLVIRRKDFTTTPTETTNYYLLSNYAVNLLTFVYTVVHRNY